MNSFNQEKVRLFIAPDLRRNWNITLVPEDFPLLDHGVEIQASEGSKTKELEKKAMNS
jgi:hypothetical protein